MYFFVAISIITRGRAMYFFVAIATVVRNQVFIEKLCFCKNNSLTFIVLLSVFELCFPRKILLSSSK